MEVPAWTWRWPWMRWVASSSPAWVAGPGGRRGTLRGHWQQTKGKTGRERPGCRPREEGPAAGARPYILCGESTEGQGRCRAGLAPPSCHQHMPCTFLSHPCCSPSLLPPFPTAPLSSLPHRARVPRSHPTPHKTTQHSYTQTHHRTVTLRTYRSANKICGNRRKGVRQGRGSAARSHPAPLSRWQ